jgi:tRNA pseudouridine55 synthase
MPSGILLLDKPLGLSSNGALQRVRRLLAGAKAGHAGSLDPLATGMLPICLGEATKIAGDIVAGAKRYRFTIALGRRTATADAEGEVTEEAAVPALTRAGVEPVLAGFLGPRTQVPPMYSALKQGGAPLYRLARAGLSVERAARSIELHELVVLALGARSLELETRCSKGTYVRVLAEEIAGALGTVGHVSALRRLSVRRRWRGTAPARRLPPAPPPGRRAYGAERRASSQGPDGPGGVAGGGGRGRGRGGAGSALRRGGEVPGYRDRGGSAGSPAAATAQ